MPSKIAINEAVELAKRYSGEDGHRFINGVLRRVIEQEKVSTEHLSANSVSESSLEEIGSPKDIQ